MKSYLPKFSAIANLVLFSSRRTDVGRGRSGAAVCSAGIGAGIETHIRLLSEHAQAALAAGWQLTELREQISLTLGGSSIRLNMPSAVQLCLPPVFHPSV